MVLRFGHRGRKRRQEAEEEPQLLTPEPEQETESPVSFQSAEDSEIDEAAQIEASEAAAVSEEPPLAEGNAVEGTETPVISEEPILAENNVAEGMKTPVVSEEIPPAESDTRSVGAHTEAAQDASSTPSPEHAISDSLPLLNTLLRLHGAEDIDSLVDAASQLVRTYLSGTHLLVLTVDKGGSFHLQTAKSGATRKLLEQLSDTLGIDVRMESPPPRQGRIAKIWLDDTASAQAASLADFWGALAGEETCWRAEKVLALSQVTAIRLASPEEPLGIALFLSQGEPPDLAMLDAVGRHLTVALGSHLDIEKARQFGSIDPVRWIPDHSEFTRQLSREVSRAHRYGQPLSLALLAVDNFDALRLEYGWTVANRLLRSISSTLAECMRESDYLGSYHHNGFGVILVQASEEMASQAANRFREAATGVRALEGEDSPVPECVVAIASYPTDADDARTLLVAAESRLLPKRRLTSASA